MAIKMLKPIFKPISFTNRSPCVDKKKILQPYCKKIIETSAEIDFNNKHENVDKKNQREYRQNLYSSKEWKILRRKFLAENPLCVFCKMKNKLQSASVVDHIKPHRGNTELFYNWQNLQSLCKSCHDSTKKRIENQYFK